MKKIVIAVGVLLVLFLAVLFVVPSLIPSETYRTRIQAQLSQELDREVRIDGDVSLSTFPLIKAKAGRATIANPDGFSRDAFVTLEGLEARVKLLPLLSKRVEISGFTLIKPDILLERRADGAVNWAFGDETKAPEDDGPFQRDGRMTNIDPAINALRVQSGTVQYRDAVAGTSVNATEVNAFLSLPGLDQPLDFEGSATVDGRDMQANLAVSDLWAFLNGQQSTIVLDAETEGARINIDGVTPPGANFAFIGDIDAALSDMALIAPYLPDAEMVSLFNRASVEGTVDLTTDRYALDDGTLTLDGDNNTLRFDGSGRYTDTPSLNGKLSADLGNIQAFKSLVPDTVQGFDLLRTAKVDATVKTVGASDVMQIDGLSAALTGTGLKATATGSAQIDPNRDAPLDFTGAFTADIDDAGKLAARFVPDQPATAVLGATTLSGKAAITGTDVTLTNLTARSQSDTLSASYEGQATVKGEAISATGRYSANIPDIATLIQRAQIDAPADAAVLGAVDVTGDLTLTSADTLATDLVATISSPTLSGRYEGALIKAGETLSLDGRFNADVPDVSALDAATSEPIPYADALGRVALSGTVTGPTDAVALDNLDAGLSDGDINGRYTGSAQLGDATRLDGALSVEGASLRTLAARAGTTLPPASGQAVFEGFGLRGQVSGTPQAITLSDATITLDQLSGTGRFAIDMAGTKPKLTGTLDLGPLDLRPYMNAYSAQNPTGEIQPWSTQPIPVEPLRSLDADLAITAQSVQVTRINLGPTRMDVALQNGRLSANAPALALYGGKGAASFVLDGSGSIPAVEIKAGLSQLDSEGFLTALAGFTQASGRAATQVDLRGSGRSQAEIMKSLQGAGDMQIVNGAVSGIDVTEFLTGLDQAFTARRLPGGIGDGKITQFKDLLSGFKISNGVATLGEFKLDAAGFAAEGSGQVDLGAQTLDFRFRPRSTADGVRGLTAFGIPLRFSGGFGSAKAGLDTEFLGEIVTARAQQEVQGLITDKIGGDAGNIIGSLIGGDTNQPASSDPNRAPATSPRPEDILGGLLGGGRTPTPQDTQTQPPAETVPSSIQDLRRQREREAAGGEPTPTDTTKTDEEPDTVEGALFDLFGLGSKDED